MLEGSCDAFLCADACVAKVFARAVGTRGTAIEGMEAGALCCRRGDERVARPLPCEAAAEIRAIRVSGRVSVEVRYPSWEWTAFLALIFNVFDVEGL